jgi:hypothetical protein
MKLAARLEEDSDDRATSLSFRERPFPASSRAVQLALSLELWESTAVYARRARAEAPNAETRKLQQAKSACRQTSTRLRTEALLCVHAAAARGGPWPHAAASSRIVGLVGRW